MPRATRRQFMVGCSAAIAGMAGTRFGNLLFADDFEAGDLSAWSLAQP